MRKDQPRPRTPFPLQPRTKVLQAWLVLVVSDKSFGLLGQQLPGAGAILSYALLSPSLTSGPLTPSLYYRFDDYSHPSTW